MTSSVMLAYSKIPAIEDIKWPKWGSPKLDGIRCYLKRGVLSRNDKPIPNKHIHDKLLQFASKYPFDGEIMVPEAADFNAVQSAVMSTHGSPKFTFNVFDYLYNPKLSATRRIEEYTRLVHELDNPMFVAVEQRLLNNGKEMLAYMDECVAKGYEGLILKAPHGEYKFGRSTLKQQVMLKYKYFQDDEGIIVDVYELMHNADTSCKKLENMQPGNTLGGFVVSWQGHIFNVGGGEGMSAELRKHYWNIRKSLIGKKLTFKYQGVSANGIPRFPTYKVLRDVRV